jgi:hypothetical protein
MDKTVKVVSINTPYQIVLNIGKDDDVSINDKFLIFGMGEMIKDLDTGEELERLEIPRGKGKVVHLQNKICTVESIEISETPTTIKRTNRFSSGFANIFPNIEESEIRRDKLPFEEVQIGDCARKIK